MRLRYYLGLKSFNVKSNYYQAGAYECRMTCFVQGGQLGFRRSIGVDFSLHVMKIWFRILGTFLVPRLGLCLWNLVLREEEPHQIGVASRTYVGCMLLVAFFWDGVLWYIVLQKKVGTFIQATPNTVWCSACLSLLLSWRWNTPTFDEVKWWKVPLSQRESFCTSFRCMGFNWLWEGSKDFIISVSAVLMKITPCRCSICYPDELLSLGIDLYAFIDW